MVRRRLPSPAMIVAIVALVVGLTGSAVALAGQEQRQVQRHRAEQREGVGSARPGRCMPHALDLFKTQGVPGPLVTTSQSPISLGGPTVSVNVPETGLIVLYARVTGQLNGGGQNALAQVHLFEPNLLPNSPSIMTFTSPDPTIRYTVPGPGDNDGVSSPTRGGFLVFSPVTPGRTRSSCATATRVAARRRSRTPGLWAGVMQ